MITATEALHLEHVRLTPKELTEVAEVLAEIDQHIREHMKFGGFAGDTALNFLVPGVTVLGGITALKSHVSSDAVAKAVCLKMSHGTGWSVSANLYSVPSRFRQGVADPHHWTFQIIPMTEAYTDDLFAPSDLVTH